MRRVIVGVPCHDGKVDVWFAHSLVESVLLCLSRGIRLFPLYMAYDSLVQRARNDLLASAVLEDVDDLLWIDSDVEWDPEWLPSFFEKPVDVLGFPVIKKSLNGQQYNVKCPPEHLVQDERGLIKVQSVGSGFLRMSRKACRVLWDISQPYVHNGRERRWAYEVKIQNGDIISEDVLACQKLRENGIDVWIDPTKTCNHVGPHKFTGDFYSFIKSVNEAQVA